MLATRVGSVDIQATLPHKSSHSATAGTSSITSRRCRIHFMQHPLWLYTVMAVLSADNLVLDELLVCSLCCDLISTHCLLVPRATANHDASLRNARRARLAGAALLDRRGGRRAQQAAQIPVGYFSWHGLDTSTRIKHRRKSTQPNDLEIIRK